MHGILISDSLFCTGVGLKTYMQVPDPIDPKASAIVRYDPVLQLLKNTLESPASVRATLNVDRSVVECPSVSRTFLNAVRFLRGGVPLTMVARL